MPPPDSSEFDLSLLQKERHHEDLASQLDVLIHQGEQHNPEAALETIIHQLDRIQTTLETLVATLKNNPQTMV